ncbi:MAG: four helix bundle suffix domain-containing protein [Porphyromonas sp.]|nr:four helix bundle suffix domain-containing protein [Porphyromonas sp.]
MKQILRPHIHYEELYCYQKAESLYRMTYTFCERFLPAHGDRTVDQMKQAARSGKQNIVEGLEDGKASIEMEIRLLNVARASLRELREDYLDYLKTRGLETWTREHPRYDGLLQFCRSHNVYEDYAELLQRCQAEEFCNIALTLCHMVDRMLQSYLEVTEREFLAEGGIKERMYAARVAQRQLQSAPKPEQTGELSALRAEVATLRSELARLQARLERLEQASEG